MIYSQNVINGKIYGNKTVAKYIKVSNSLKSVITYSDESGYFSIKASIGDSILFSSSFYKEHRTLVDSSHFSNTIVIQLKEKVNELDAVILNDNFRNKKFSTMSYNTQLKSVLNSDFHNKPWEYKLQPASRHGVNLKGLKYLKDKLLSKRRKGYIPIIYEPITFHDLEKLNQNDTYFSDVFFSKDLKIPKDFKYQFFGYVEDKKISSKYLNKEHRFYLIDIFFKLSNSFLERINKVNLLEN